MNCFLVAWGLITICLCLYGIGEMTGFPFYYIREARAQYKYENSNYVVSTEFFNRIGMISSVHGDGNITGDDGPYYKVVHFRDGSQVAVNGDQYRTWGSGMDLK